MAEGEYPRLIAFLTERFEVIDRRFDAQEQRATEFRQEVLGHLDALHSRLERLEQEYHAITAALRRIEAALGDERARRDTLERSVQELKDRVAMLQGRIVDIERRLSLPGR